MMDNALTVLFIASAAILLGGMIFFPTVVAPKVFSVLDERSAGQFLRALFPAYYMFIIAAAGVAALTGAGEKPVYAAVFALTAASTLAIRQALVPQLNAWRDEAAAGDGRSERKFAQGHRLSVIVNAAQLIAVAAVLIDWTLTHAA